MANNARYVYVPVLKFPFTVFRHREDALIEDAIEERASMVQGGSLSSLVVDLFLLNFFSDVKFQSTVS